MDEITPETAARYARWVASHRKRETILCEFCGRTALVYATDPPARYCSTNCRVKAWQHRRRAKR